MSVFIGDKAKRVELAERKDAINPNLFRNTDKLDNFWKTNVDNHGVPEDSANYASDTNYELIATKSVFHAFGPTAMTSAILTKQQIYFEPGLYTISFLARNNGTDQPSFNMSLYSDYTDKYGGVPLGSTSTNLTNVWQQYSITFKIVDAGTYSNWRLLNYSTLGLPGGSLFFANLKLEHGPVATLWCPALEDYAMQPDIASLQNAISSELAEKKDIINPNLFTGSKDFTGEWINIQKDVQKDKYLDFTAICINMPWHGASQYIAVNKGETLTASMYVKAKTGSSLFWVAYLNSDNESGYKKVSTSPYNKPINGTGNWQRTSFTFTVTGDNGAIKPRIENDGSSPYWIAGMKLEKGTVTTDWCPALEDYAWESDITTLQNTLNSINSQVMAVEAGYMKKPTVISQADYNKLATKDPNTLYEITE